MNLDLIINEVVKLLYNIRIFISERSAHNRNEGDLNERKYFRFKDTIPPDCLTGSDLTQSITIS